MQRNVARPVLGLLAALAGLTVASPAFARNPSPPIAPAVRAALGSAGYRGVEEVRAGHGVTVVLARPKRRPKRLEIVAVVPGDTRPRAVPLVPVGPGDAVDAAVAPFAPRPELLDVSITTTSQTEDGGRITRTTHFVLGPREGRLACRIPGSVQTRPERCGSSRSEQVTIVATPARPDGFDVVGEGRAYYSEPDRLQPRSCFMRSPIRGEPYHYRYTLPKKGPCRSRRIPRDEVPGRAPDPPR